MHWLKLTVEATEADAVVVEAALSELGALAVTLTGAGEDPVLEPAPGATPLWSRLRVTGLFEAERDATTLTDSLRPTLPNSASIAIELMQDQDWVRAWLRDYRPMRFGTRLWICPSNARVAARDAVVMELDPGLAFGTGTHPSTALCLEWLDAAELRGKRVIDYGCGSGVLAIAAALLGARQVHAVDIDPQAEIAAADNARRNGVAERLDIGKPADLAIASAEVLVANILAAPLIDLAPRFAALVKPHGLIVLAGLLDHQGDGVRTAYEPWFELDAGMSRSGWLRLAGRRRT